MDMWYTDSGQVVYWEWTGGILVVDMWYTGSGHVVY